MFFRICVVVVLAVESFVFCQYSQPRVTLRQGVVVGSTLRTDSGLLVNSFLGIPYASPPIGDLRFLPPQKHNGWNSTLQATEYGKRCLQLPINTNDEIVQSEDCLFLNIWSPENAGRDGFLPVLLFFDGTDFAKDGGIYTSGMDMAAEGVVVVTANYRLNIFGFFCLGTEQARGNIGLLDQYFVLLWVRENIRNFGGDAQKITLFGHGSGAASVVLHMVSPRTAGLFHKAIVSSGSAVSPWYIDNNPIAASKEIIRILGCNLYQINSLKCLQTKPADSILRAYEEFIEAGLITDTFYPVIDTFLPENNQYLPIEPGQTLKDGTYYQVPILTGINSFIPNKQQTFWIELASKGYSNLERYIEKSKIPEIMKMFRFEVPNRDEIFELIKWQCVSPSLGNARLLIEELKQMEFETKTEVPHFMQLNYLLSSYIQSIYVYYLNYNGFSLNKSGVTPELLLLFGPSLLHQIGRRGFTEDEMRLHKKIKRLWLNFIAVGNPTPNTNTRIWRKYTSDDNFIEYLGNGEIDEKESYRKAKRLAFWTQLLPKIASRKPTIPNTIPTELQKSPDPAAGYKHGLYVLIGLVLALLALLLICVFLLKKRYTDKQNEMHMGF